jgi:para-aminobenzoate synthetase/4-amino-4-deoxychorismate lyase
VTRNPTPYVRLDTDVSDAGNRQMLFEQPTGELRLESGGDPRRFFGDIEEALSRRLWVAGYFTYETGYLFEPRLRPLLESRKPDGPLAWVGLFRGPVTPGPRGDGTVDIGELRLNSSWDEYDDALARIRSFIEAGDTYQVNYTIKARFDFEGAAEALYHRLRGRQQVSYSACLFDGERSVISLSPELFLRRDGQKLISRPMKGTVRRGVTAEEDAKLADWLKNDPKNRAENVMIVDMIRNDLGRVAPPGGVRVTGLFDIEPYESLHQMTSTVEARIPDGTTWYDIFSRMYPCASITGAPKIRTMELIAALEKEPRGVYTGAIGYFSPDGDACLSVAIRTLVAGKDGAGEMGIGSGVVYDSDPVSEFEECLLKAQFVSKPRPVFDLVETMLLENGEIVLMDRHLDRLEVSADCFDYPFDRAGITSGLSALRDSHPAGSFRVRLLLRADGRYDLSVAALEPPLPEYRVRISSRRVDESDPMLFHKTTHRPLYTTERRRALEDGYDEVLFVNGRDEVTEGSVTNVFVETGGKLLTPPVGCGVLPGTLRQELIDTGRCAEAVITTSDLRSADRVYAGNSVRGLVPVRLV